MKAVLLQEERYLPTFGGSHKANRRLLEELARRGHRCLAICPARNPRLQPDPTLPALRERRVALRWTRPWLVRFRYRGVAVDGTDTPDLARRAAHARRRIRAFAPDVVFVSDDPRRYLLEAALSAAPGRVVFLAHSLWPLPFGPASAAPDAAQAERLRDVRALVVPSRFAARYVRLHGGRRAVRLRYPVDGPEPPPRLGRFENPFVTLLQPTAGKGVDTFLALADRFPASAFAVVDAWGGRPPVPAVERALRARPNVHVLPPADDIGAVLARTRVLLMPSSAPETFGLAAVEALARGVPVLASDAGGLGEALLGVRRPLPRAPAIAPWAAALALLAYDRAAWEQASRRARRAGLRHVRRTRGECDALLRRLAIET